jgi:putative RNA 2'-phosphotransferase
MMSESRAIKISKFLSYHLRHRPDKIGLELAPGGWVSVDELLAASKKHSFDIERDELDEVVASNDKKRFSFNSKGTLIRANQGHSLEVDLQLEEAVPPKVLYHGTGQGAVESIMQMGLSKMSRHHVHLSVNMATAIKVGKRHGRPVVFAVNAAAMHQAGHKFYCSNNGVWLVDHVPSKYLQIT